MPVRLRWPSLAEALYHHDAEDVRRWSTRTRALAHRDWAGQTALHVAPSASLARILITAGAPIDARDNAGLSPVDVALRRGRCGVAMALLQAGARPSANALHWAAWKGSPEVVRALLDRGFLATDPDSRGQTPLHWLFRSRLRFPVQATVVAKLLVSNGATWHTVDKRGVSPSDLLHRRQALLSSWPTRIRQGLLQLWLRFVGQKRVSETRRVQQLKALMESVGASA